MCFDTEIKDIIRDIDIDLMMTSFWENAEEPELKDKHMRHINVTLEKRMLFMEEEDE